MESRPQPLEKCHRVIQHPLSNSKWISLVYLCKNPLNKVTIENILQNAKAMQFLMQGLGL